MSLIPFCSMMGRGRGFSMSLVQLPGQGRISPEMRPACSRLCPVTAQAFWTTCSQGKVLPVQLSSSKPDFSSGWGNKKKILFTYSNESASVTLEKLLGNNTIQPLSSSELSTQLPHWYNVGVDLWNLVYARMPDL